MYEVQFYNEWRELDSMLFDTWDEARRWAQRELGVADPHITKITREV